MRQACLRHGGLADGLPVLPGAVGPDGNEPAEAWLTIGQALLLEYVHRFPRGLPGNTVQLLELPRVSRTGDFRLIYAAVSIPRSSSMTSRGVLYPSVE